MGREIFSLKCPDCYSLSAFKYFVIETFVRTEVAYGEHVVVWDFKFSRNLSER